MERAERTPQGRNPSSRSFAKHRNGPSHSSSNAQGPRQGAGRPARAKTVSRSGRGPRRAA
jgi:hypothetical protein